MTAELDLQSSLALHDVGNYTIPYSTLVEMERDQLELAEVKVSDVIRDNPDYEFCVVHDDFNRLAIIKWRKVK